MRLVIIFLIGLMLIDAGLMGNIGSMLGAIITPDAMIDTSKGA